MMLIMQQDTFYRKATLEDFFDDGETVIIITMI